MSTDAAAPSAASTVLASELTGGTLARAQGSFAHTNGTASYTLIHTFTSDRIALVLKYGTFTASVGGVLSFEAAFTDPVPLKVGDSIQIVDTISI